MRLKISFFAVKTCCSKPVLTTGIREDVSTDPAYHPPHPSTSYDHQPPNVIPAVRKTSNQKPGMQGCDQVIAVRFDHQVRKCLRKRAGKRQIRCKAPVGE